MRLEDLHSVYFMGIGGIGMSALARYFRLQGREVSGYDRTPTPLTRQLEAEGIPVVYELEEVDFGKANAVIYTPAIKRNLPAFQAADTGNIPVLKRSEVLGMITRAYKTIAVGGTHGKTTTAAMLTHLLRKGGVEATGFVGGIMKNYDSNFVFGNDDWVVVEADEFDRSFHHLSPEIAVLTSIDEDHLDIYGSRESIQAGYAEFTEKVKPEGELLLNHRLQSFAQDLSRNALFYGLDAGDFRGEKIKAKPLGSEFEYVFENERIAGLELNMAGVYNAENAIAAITAARMAGASVSGIKEGLRTFLGIKRRFDVQYISENNAYIDDYAHHPEEVKALLSSIKEQFPGWKIVVAFQPHLYSRTNDFYEGFAESLSLADRVVVLKIYPAREEPMEGVSSALIFDQVEAEEKALSDKAGLLEILKNWAGPQQVILTVGAGDIDTKVAEVRNLVSAW